MLPILKPNYMPLSNLERMFNMDSFGKDYSSLNIPIEVFDKETSWLIKAYLPGVHKEDIHLDVENGKLFISAVRHNPKEKVYLSEIEYGKVETTVKLISTNSLDKENISAKLNNGILEINIKKPKESLPYKVQIE